MTLAEVGAHLRASFARAGIAAEPESASVTFLGVEDIKVLRFGPDRDGVLHYVSLGCSRHPMGDDPVRGPRAEVVVSLRGTSTGGLARSVAVLAAAPAVEGLVLAADALVDLGQPLWELAPFSAFLLGPSDIDPMTPVSTTDTASTADTAATPATGSTPDTPAVEFFRAVPITATEAAWVRLKGAEAMRLAWRQDGVDVLDPAR